VLPIVPIPVWILGIVLTLTGAYQSIFGNSKGIDGAPEVVKEQIQPIASDPKSVSTPTQENSQLGKAQKLEQESKIEYKDALAKVQKEMSDMAPKVIAQMEESLESIKKLKGTPAGDQYEALMRSQDPDNPMTLDDAIAKMEKSIEEYKQKVNSMNDN